MTTGYQTTSIGGLDIACLSMSRLVDLMADYCRQEGPAKLVFDANGQALSMNQTDAAYRDAMKAADLIHADGQFLVWTSHLLREARVPERSATTDLIWAAAERAQRDGLSFFLLGGPEKLAENAARKLRDRFPSLKIAGTRTGFFHEEDEDALIAEINNSGADIVWLGLGKPKEQQFAARNKHRFTASWVVTCGGCFNYMTGAYRRAPGWMQVAGIEWLHRMFTGPKALRRRYLTTTPHALFLALTK
jgi:N-acetylglucosaminyldiphosphoundecaprenol N-acetyl-beta-D-mannosaminyltransferase